MRQFQYFGLERVVVKCQETLHQWETSNMVFLKEERREWVEVINQIIELHLNHIGMMPLNVFYIEIVEMGDQAILRFSPHLVALSSRFNVQLYSSVKGVDNVRIIE